MFQAKKEGGNRYRFYLADMTRTANERLALETDLRHALERDEFVLHCQPQVSLVYGRISWGWRRFCGGSIRGTA